MRRLILLMFSLTALLAQQNSPDAARRGSIAGIVKDATTGSPIAEVKVQMTIPGPGTDLIITTDSQGHYSFNDLPEGRYFIFASILKAGRTVSLVQRIVTMKAGQNATLDIPLLISGSITGKVVDEKGEALPGVTVWLVGREYYAGVLRSLFKAAAQTNDQGEYTLEGVEPGRSWLVYAQIRAFRIEAISEVPADPKLRRQVLTPAFYPNSRDMNGAAPLSVRSGERLEAINIKMTKAPGYCLDGLVANTGVPGPLNFSIGPSEPSYGAGTNGGLVGGSNPGGVAGQDGPIRICELPAGVYTLNAIHGPKTQSGSKALPSISSVTVTVGDRDLHGIQLEALPAQPLQGEVVWDGIPPKEAIVGKVSLSVLPWVRAHFQGEQNDVSVSVPGTFTLPAVPSGAYSFLPRVPDGLYVKDITYAGNSVMRTMMHAGSAMGNASLRVLVAAGAAKITVNVFDKKGNPLGGINVVALPAANSDPASLAAALTRSSTDQDGNCTLARLAPGKYYVLAVDEAIDYTPELMQNLLLARTTKATEVEVGHGGTVQAAIKVSSLQ